MANFAAREPADDVRRRLRSACEESGLSVKKTSNVLVTLPDSGKQARFVSVWADPVEVHAFVYLDGTFSKPEIRVGTGEGSMTYWDDYYLQNCACEISDLVATLKSILEEREAIRQGKVRAEDTQLLRWEWKKPRAF